MIRFSALVLVPVLAAGGIALAGTPPPSVQIHLAAQPGSKITGTATIAHVSMDPPVVDVGIVLDGVFIPENAYPAGVYRGTCAKVRPAPDYRLKPVIGGRSQTRVKPTVMKPGPYVVAVFDTSGTRSISCGALPVMHHEK